MKDARRHILLVDDDPDFLEAHRQLFEAAGYRVSCATDPHEAERLMETDKPDVVITDLMMRALDSGFSFVRRLRDNPHFADVRVIIVTAVSSRRGFDFRPRTREDIAAMRADAFFEKPASPEQLMTTVRQLLEREKSGGEK